MPAAGAVNVVVIDGSTIALVRLAAAVEGVTVRAALSESR